jgi:hypothetical protein
VGAAVRRHGISCRIYGSACEFLRQRIVNTNKVSS